MSLVTLHDRESGAEAKISIERGVNCFSWRVPHRGQMHELLWSENRFAQGAGRPSGSGIPLLFPFPGRIAGAQFESGGQTWSLPAGDGKGNAIHGFVLDRPWELENESAASVSAVFRTADHLPDAKSLWPAEFALQCRHELSAGQLSISLSVHNPSDDPLPCGLGLHPYFRVATDHPDSHISLPVSLEYQLHDLIPNGETIPLPSATNGQITWPSAQRHWDHVYGGISFADDGSTVASVYDGERNLEIECRWDTSFPYCVLYTPPHRSAVCIEPYSTLPNPFQLEQQGVTCSWWHIPPRTTKEVQVEFRVHFAD